MPQTPKPKPPKLLFVHLNLTKVRGRRRADVYRESRGEWGTYRVTDSGLLIVTRPDGRMVTYADGVWDKVETRWETM